jgi:hypothetical protein
VSRVQGEDTVKIRVRAPSRCWTRTLAGRDVRKAPDYSVYWGKILRAESERRLAAGSVYIFGLNERYAIDGHAQNTARYSNHSCDPNHGTVRQHHLIVAIKDIRGEELL